MCTVIAQDPGCHKLPCVHGAPLAGGRDCAPPSPVQRADGSQGAEVQLVRGSGLHAHLRNNHMCC